MMAMTMHGTRMRGLSIQLLTEGRHRGDTRGWFPKLASFLAKWGNAAYGTDCHVFS
jgi:hypothetical protein